MADYIEVETRSLGQDRDNIQNQAEAVRGKLSQLLSSMENLSGMWEGPAKEVFMEQFYTDYEFMQEFLTEMDKYVQAMSYAQQEYDKCENDVAQIVGAIQI
nr:WXG100 family type VII secretion target [uncultured Blautia sp.]